MEKTNGIYLNKASALPLYEQLRKGILECILNGQFPYGSKLPTEEELCETYDISRPVARQAYSALIEAGYVERQRGKGTFVKTPDNRGRYINKQMSFAQEMGAMGLKHKTVLIKAEWATYDENLFSMLGLTEQDRCYHIIRMRYVQEKPFVLVENYVPETAFPGIEQYNFEENSLYRILNEVYHTHIVRSHRTMAAILATDEIATTLEIAKGSPIMYVKNLVYDEMDRPIDLSKEYLDGSSHRYEFDVYNN
ncbi:MAG: GntR family transcriptional regulator [Lachnospiraceae bacterium]|nr:GntR family transcriptional regulator [Lachnospiraceae bacterium]